MPRVFTAYFPAARPRFRLSTARRSRYSIWPFTPHDLSPASKSAGQEQTPGGFQWRADRLCITCEWK